MAPAEAVGYAADGWALLYQDPTAGSSVLSVGVLILLNVASSRVLLGLSHRTVVTGSRISYMVTDFNQNAKAVASAC